MRKELTNSGWKEITVKNIEVTLKNKNVFATASQWIKVTAERPKLANGGRVACDRCGLKWVDCISSMPTFFLQTNKGNKIVCENCYNEIDAPEVERD